MMLRFLVDANIPNAPRGSRGKTRKRNADQVSKSRKK